MQRLTLSGPGKDYRQRKSGKFAARGGLKNKKYPWGDDENWAPDYANYYGIGGKDKWEYCAPIGSLEPNGYGLFDMAGNTWEWCQNWYDSDEDARVLLGGAWDSDAVHLQVAHRPILYYPDRYNSSYGFRCVADLP